MVLLILWKTHMTFLRQFGTGKVIIEFVLSMESETLSTSNDRLCILCSVNIGEE